MMCNRKIILLSIFFLCGLSAEIFADFTFAPKVSVTLTKEEGIDLGIGLNMGMGFHRGRTFFIDALVGYRDGIYKLTTNLDWHILPWNLGMVQLYMGLGVGVQMPFDPNNFLQGPYNMTFIGRIPIGMKFFFGTVELFFEASPLLNCFYTYRTTDAKGQNIDPTHTYKLSLGVQAGTGLRVWW